MDIKNLAKTFCDIHELTDIKKKKLPFAILFVRYLIQNRGLSELGTSMPEMRNVFEKFC